MIRRDKTTRRQRGYPLDMMRQMGDVIHGLIQKIGDVVIKKPVEDMPVLEDLAEKWGAKYKAIIRLWGNTWEQFTHYDVETRKVICTTNARASTPDTAERWGPGISATSSGSPIGCDGGLIKIL